MADLGIKRLRGMGIRSVLPGGIFNLEKSETIFVQTIWCNTDEVTVFKLWPFACLLTFLGDSLHTANLN